MLRVGEIFLLKNYEYISLTNRFEVYFYVFFRPTVFNEFFIYILKSYFLILLSSKTNLHIKSFYLDEDENFS